MTKTRSFGLIVALLAVIGAGVWSVQAQVLDDADMRPVASLKRFDLKDLDGRSVALSDAQFGGVETPKRLAFCFISAGSPLSQQQARQVLEVAEHFDGQVVIVCAGQDREVRAVANLLDPAIEGKRKALWLQGATNVKTDFGPLFQQEFGIMDLRQVPALAVIGRQRTAEFVSIGEQSRESLRAALTKKPTE